MWLFPCWSTTQRQGICEPFITASLDAVNLDSPEPTSIQESHFFAAENQTPQAAKSCFVSFGNLPCFVCFFGIPTQITFGFRIKNPICPIVAWVLPNDPTLPWTKPVTRIGNPLVTAEYRICPPIGVGFLPWTVVQYSTRPSHGWTSIFYHPQFFVPECSPTLCDHAVEISGSTWILGDFSSGKTSRKHVRWYDDRRRSWEPIPWFGMGKSMAGFICLTLTWIYVSFKQPTPCGGCVKV